MVVPVVMLVRNCKMLTMNAMASLKRQDIPIDLLVVDQGSTDGIREWCQARHDLLMQAWPSNIGVSRGWNQALRYWFDTCHVPCVLVINNDVELRPDTARLLVEDGGPFVTGVSVDRREQTREFMPVHHPHPDFSCFLIRKEVWDKVGPFDEAMVNYCGDGDYHLRMHDAGVDAYNIGVPFYHERSSTIKHAGYEESERIRAQADADRQAFEKKWGFRMDSPRYCERFHSEVPAASTS